jgi:hypothetical protein
MSKEYYYHDGTEQRGPLSVSDIKSLGLTPETWVWAEGFDDWKPLREVKELQAAGNISKNTNWNEIYSKAYRTVEQQYKSGRTGAAIETLQNCTDRVFNLIRNIRDADGQKEAANEVVAETCHICNILIEELGKREEEYLSKISADIHAKRAGNINRRAKEFYESKNCGFFGLSKVYSSLGDGVEEIIGSHKAVSLWKEAKKLADHPYVHVNYNKEEIKALKGIYNEKIRKYDASATKEGGCYIATAVYGSYDCPQVWTLRRFRDNSLQCSWLGKRFIQMYYAVSPGIVRLVGNKRWFNLICKYVLDRFVKKLQNNGIDSCQYPDFC